MGKEQRSHGMNVQPGQGLGLINAPRKGTRQPLPKKAIACMVAACFAADVAVANPANPSIINGVVSFDYNGSTLTITNTPGSIINWQGFSIGVDELTRFIQQSASSAVLNRVTGVDPSVILGALQSNGHVFLINPNGVLFGAGSQIDVAGLVASSLNLSDADFLAGNLNFTATAGAGNVANAGNISTGSVYLIAPNVENSGIITSANGEVVLAAGHSVQLVGAGTPNLRVEVAATDNQALNLGQIVADSGSIGIYAGLVSNSGTLNASSAVAEGGKILLKATDTTLLKAGSTITATGAHGGNIQILGNHVGLTDNASINASGANGGGTVFIGGDYQGKNPEVKNAWRTYVGSGVSIKADAINSGDGGKVIVWSDDITRFYGSISAKGGAQSGNGGFVEISGKHNLDFNGHVDTSAANGAWGSILFDPDSIIVQNLPGTDDAQVSDGLVDFGDGGSASFLIGEAALEGLSGGVILRANHNIVILSGLTGGGLVLTAPGQYLTLEAVDNVTINSPIITDSYMNFYSNSMTINQDITSNNGDIFLIPMNFSGTNINLGGADSGGVLGLSAAELNHVHTAGTLQIGDPLFGGNITVSAALLSGAGGATQNIHNLKLDASNGTRSIAVNANINTVGNIELYTTGITVTNANLVSTGGGITFSSLYGNAGVSHHGIYIANSLIKTTGSGTINLTGYGAGPGGDAGVFLDGGAAVQSAGTGAITINGTGGPNGTSDTGVLMRPGSSISTVTGDIDISGIQGGSAGTGGAGIYIGDGPGGGMITSSGSANITLYGEGAGTEPGIFAEYSTIGGGGDTGNITFQSPSTSGILFGVGTSVVTGGDINLDANSMSLANATTISGHNIAIWPWGDGGEVDISVGGGSGLSLTQGDFDVLHTNSNGQLFIGDFLRTGDITVTAPVTFNSANVPKVVLYTRNGIIHIDGGTGGALTANDVNLIAYDVDIQGAISGFTSIDRPDSSNEIWLGSSASGNGNLNLSQTEINFINGDGGNILFGSSFGAPVVIKTSLTTGLINIFSGGSITQDAGATLNVDYLNVGAGGDVILTEVGNTIPFLSTGFQMGGGSGLQITTGFGDLTIAGTLNAAFAVQLNAVGGSILDGNTNGPDIIAPNAQLVVGSGNIGSFADPLETQLESLSLLGSSASVAGIFNTGDLGVIFNPGFASATVQTTGLLRLGSDTNIVGALALFADDILIDTDLATGGSLLLSAANNLNIAAGNVFGNINVSGQTVALLGNNVTVGDATSNYSTSVSSNGALGVVAGTFKVGGGASTNAYAVVSSSSGSTGVLTTGDVIVAGGSGDGAFAHLFGSPDVDMNVGGVIHIDAGTGVGAYGRIESGVPTSIHVQFPNLTEGGYFVNGLAQVSGGGSGFYADGSPAILGLNLLIDYGDDELSQPGNPSGDAIPQPIRIAIEQIVDQTNRADTNRKDKDEETDGSDDAEGGGDDGGKPTCS